MKKLSNIQKVPTFEEHISKNEEAAEVSYEILKNIVDNIGLVADAVDLTREDNDAIEDVLQSSKLLSGIEGETEKVELYELPRSVGEYGYLVKEGDMTSGELSIRFVDNKDLGLDILHERGRHWQEYGELKDVYGPEQVRLEEDQGLNKEDIKKALGKLPVSEFLDKLISVVNSDEDVKMEVEKRIGHAATKENIKTWFKSVDPSEAKDVLASVIMEFPSIRHKMLESVDSSEDGIPDSAVIKVDKAIEEERYKKAALLLHEYGADDTELVKVLLADRGHDNEEIEEVMDHFDRVVDISTEMVIEIVKEKFGYEDEEKIKSYLKYLNQFEKYDDLKGSELGEKVGELMKKVELGEIEDPIDEDGNVKVDFVGKDVFEETKPWSKIGEHDNWEDIVKEIYSDILDKFPLEDSVTLKKDLYNLISSIGFTMEDFTVVKNEDLKKLASELDTTPDKLRPQLSNKLQDLKSKLTEGECEECRMDLQEKKELLQVIAGVMEQEDEIDYTEFKGFDFEDIEGWDRESLLKFAATMMDTDVEEIEAGIEAGDIEGFWTTCYDKLIDEEGFDEERTRKLCSALKDEVLGTTAWRGEPEPGA